MLHICALILGCLLMCALPAQASTSEVREVARLYSCNPKKIEVISASLGTPSQTVYRVQCNMPRVSGGASAERADSVLIRCSGSLCNMIRAVPKK